MAEIRVLIADASLPRLGPYNSATEAGLAAYQWGPECKWVMRGDGTYWVSQGREHETRCVWCSAPTFNPDARCDACTARVVADLDGAA